MTVPAEVPDFNLDHFKFWSVEAGDFGITVGVNEPGQPPFGVRLGKPEYLGNPALKNHDPQPASTIKNHELHYVGYPIIDSEANRPSIDVLNQFTSGSERWVLGRPVWLLVPASKAIDGSPAEPSPGEHFLCFDVTHSPVHGRVTIQDQFDVRRDKVEDITPTRPTHFAVPVQKHHHSTTPPVQDRTTGLALYPIPLDRYSIDVRTRDQFRDQPLRVKFSEYLAVPSYFENA